MLPIKEEEFEELINELMEEVLYTSYDFLDDDDPFEISDIEEEEGNCSGYCYCDHYCDYDLDYEDWE